MSDGETLIMALARGGAMRALVDVQQALPGGVLAIPLSADVPSRALDLLGEKGLRLVLSEGLGGRDVEILDGPAAGQVLRKGMTGEWLATKSTAWMAIKLGIPEREVRALKRQIREAAE